MLDTVVQSFIQQIFAELLLCVRHCVRQQNCEIREIFPILRAFQKQTGLPSEGSEYLVAKAKAGSYISVLDWLEMEEMHVTLPTLEWFMLVDESRCISPSQFFHIVRKRLTNNMIFSGKQQKPMLVNLQGSGIY